MPSRSEEEKKEEEMNTKVHHFNIHVEMINCVQAFSLGRLRPVGDNKSWHGSGHEPSSAPHETGKGETGMVSTGVVPLFDYSCYWIVQREKKKLRRKLFKIYF